MLKMIEISTGKIIIPDESSVIRISEGDTIITNSGRYKCVKYRNKNYNPNYHHIDMEYLYGFEKVNKDV